MPPKFAAASASGARQSSRADGRACADPLAPRDGELRGRQPSSPDALRAKGESAPRAAREKFCLISAGRDRPKHYFLPYGFWPPGGLLEANGEGAAPPFLMFLSAFGFFFS